MELELKWTKHCVLASAGTENTDANSDNIIFTIKDIKRHFISKRQSKTVKIF